MLDSHATKVSTGIKQAARDALASSIEPTEEAVLPPMFTLGIPELIAKAVGDKVIKEGLSRK
jgi:malic enzyme